MQAQGRIVEGNPYKIEMMSIGIVVTSDSKKQVISKIKREVKKQIIGIFGEKYNDIKIIASCEGNIIKLICTNPNVFQMFHYFKNYRANAPMRFEKDK